MNINMNLVCEHHDLVKVLLTCSSLNHLSYWSFVNNLNFMNKVEKGWTLGWKFMNFMNITFVIQEHSWIVHEHIY